MVPSPFVIDDNDDVDIFLLLVLHLPGHPLGHQQHLDRQGGGQLLLFVLLDGGNSCLQWPQ